MGPGNLVTEPEQPAPPGQEAPSVLPILSPPG